MGQTNSERRWAENEVVFRQANEKVSKELESLKQAAEAEGHASLVHNIERNLDNPIHFYCECSDELCRQRIILKPSEYKNFHKNSSQFTVLPGHDVARIERVVAKTDSLMVVEKYLTPSKSVSKLRSTTIDNS